MVKRQPKGIPVGGQFAENAHDEAASSLVEPLHDKTPDYIDTILAEKYSEEMRLRMERELAIRRRDRHDADDRPFYISEEKWEAQTTRFHDAVDEIDDGIASMVAEQEPYEAEFRRRGGWTRAFLTTGSNGHVHKDRSCSTCFPTTSYYWVTEMSGKDENEIVDAAGEKACTVCYPSAPVDVLRKPSRIEDPAVIAEREKRAAEKAKRDADRAAKGITDPATGGRLMLGWQEIKTEVTAEREAVDRIVRIKVDGVEPYNNRDFAQEGESELKRLVEALAAKRGMTNEEVFNSLEEKAKKKFKRDSGWLLSRHGLSEVPDTKVDWL